MTFKDWFAANLPTVKRFSAEELLVKGGSHANNRLNADPPPELWPNVVPLAMLLEKFRSRVGRPVILHSVYRTPAYNAAIGGAPNSLHKEFKAADFSLADPDSGPADWAATLRAMRANAVFLGGIGTYDTFVHVDVRGANVDWDYRDGPKTVGRVINLGDAHG